MPRPKGSKNKPKTGNDLGSVSYPVARGDGGPGSLAVVPYVEATDGGLARMQWCYTSFDRRQVDAIQAVTGLVHVVGRERAPTTDRVHYQGVVRFPRRFSFAELRLLAPDAHWEVCRNFRAAVVYCRKDHDMVYDNGPTTQREDMEAVWNYVIREVSAHPTAETCRRLAQEHPRFWMMWGRRVKDWLGDAFFTPTEYMLPNFSLPPS